MHPRPDTGCIYGNKKGQDHAAHFIIRYFEVFKTLLPQKLPQYSFQITAGRVCFFCLSFFCGRQLLFGLRPDQRDAEPPFCLPSAAPAKRGV